MPRRTRRHPSATPSHRCGIDPHAVLINATANVVGMPSGRNRRAYRRALDWYSQYVTGAVEQLASGT